MLFSLRASHSSSPRSLAVTLAVAASALTLTAGAAQAQSSGSAAGSSSASGAPGITSTGTPGASSPNATGANGATDPKASNTPSAAIRADGKLVNDIIQANHSEIATGQLALEKSQNAEVKKFAQQMIDDHGSALKEVTALASSRGMTVPDGPDLKHKTLATAMKALSGNAFDSQYVKRAGVDDHVATLALLRKTQKDAKDADVKLLASKMQPTVEHHLMMARQLVTGMGKK